MSPTECRPAGVLVVYRSKRGKTFHFMLLFEFDIVSTSDLRRTYVRFAIFPLGLFDLYVVSSRSLGYSNLRRLYWASTFPTAEGPCLKFPHILQNKSNFIWHDVKTTWTEMTLVVSHHWIFRMSCFSPTRILQMTIKVILWGTLCQSFVHLVCQNRPSHACIL